jgi:hypothetical protein
MAGIAQVSLFMPGAESRERWWRPHPIGVRILNVGACYALVGVFRLRELVITFHGLGDPPPHVPTGERPYWCSPDIFADFLNRISELKASSTALKISITFDDGNASDFLIALPELAKRQLTATFFVCAGRIGEDHYLDASMIRELVSSNMNLGSHGMFHRAWPGLPAREFEIEIVDARKIIEDVIGQEVTSAAVPFGLYNRRVLQRLRQGFWQCVYTSDRGTTEESAWLKPRQTIDATMQDQDIINEFSARPSLHTRARRMASNFYKRLR